MCPRILKKALFSTFFFSLLFNACFINAEPTTIDKAQENLSQEISILKADLDTTQRVILQSIVEIFWEYIKENSNNTKLPVIKDNGKTYTLDLTDFGKTLSNLAIDEKIPTPEQNISQKTAELLIPTAVAFILVKMMLKDNGKEKNYTFLTTELAFKLLIKMTMIRWFVKPKNKIYPALNLMAILGSFYKYDSKEKGFYRFFNLNQGIVKLTQDQIKTLVDASDLGETLNKAHRKKAIRKIIQALIAPYVEWTCDNLKGKAS